MHRPGSRSVEGLRLRKAIRFDSFVFEDALLYRDGESSQGCWESVSIAAARGNNLSHRDWSIGIQCSVSVSSDDRQTEQV